LAATPATRRCHANHRANCFPSGPWRRKGPPNRHRRYVTLHNTPIRLPTHKRPEFHTHCRLSREISWHLAAALLWHHGTGEEFHLGSCGSNSPVPTADAFMEWNLASYHTLGAHSVCDRAVRTWQLCRYHARRCLGRYPAAGPEKGSIRSRMMLVVVMCWSVALSAIQASPDRVPKRCYLDTGVCYSA
jgi:hypothetical protein